MDPSQELAFLEKVRINNFLSLHDIEFALKPLTVLVGANASGKSNVLRGLDLLRRMMSEDKLPSSDYLQDVLWAGGADHIGFQLDVKINDAPVLYKLELSPTLENQIMLEQLQLHGIDIISIQEGQGIVRDENDHTKETLYRPSRPKLALKSAGDYGDKPITSALYEFIQNWKFYDFEPGQMRNSEIWSQILRGASSNSTQPQPTHIDDDGSRLNPLLLNWYKNYQEQFSAVNDALKRCINRELEHGGSNGDAKLYLREGYKKAIPLKRASDGTLRLIAYNVLLHQQKLPSLIAIEEPERNLHPAALQTIASLLEQLAERTQVIITTHSAQLLDSFSPNSLGDQLGVLLLHHVAGEGTKVIDLEDVRQNRSALDGWIADFGIGSAIFQSKLLADAMEG